MQLPTGVSLISRLLPRLGAAVGAEGPGDGYTYVGKKRMLPCGQLAVDIIRVRVGVGVGAMCV